MMTETDFYSFSDLKERWNITSEKLHKFIAEGKVIPSLFFNEKKIIKAFNYQYYAEDNLPLSLYLAFSIRKIKSGYHEIPVKDSRGNYSGWHYLIFPVLNGKSKYYFETTTKNIDEYLDHGVLYRHYEEYEPKKQKSISFDNLFIEEYAGFEHEYIKNNERVLLEANNLPNLNVKAGLMPDYFSEDLQTLVYAAYNFWSAYDVTDKTRPSSNKEVENWLISNGFSKRNAEAGATIIRLYSRRGDLDIE
jgi:hypothetical protein